jgi:hypothetical protein
MYTKKDHQNRTAGFSFISLKPLSQLQKKKFKPQHSTPTHGARSSVTMNKGLHSSLETEFWLRVLFTID